MSRRDPDDDETDEAEGVSAAEAQAAFRFGVTLLLALVLAAPALLATLEGRRDVEYAAFRFLVCFVAARLGVGLVAHLHGGYRRERALAAHAERSAPPAPTRTGLPGSMTESR